MFVDYDFIYAAIKYGMIILSQQKLDGLYAIGVDKSAFGMDGLPVEKFFQGFTEKSSLNKNHVFRICTMYVYSPTGICLLEYITSNIL